MTKPDQPKEKKPLRKPKAVPPIKRKLPPGARIDDRIMLPDDPKDLAAEMGRPSLFKFEYVEQVERLGMLNLSNREIAHTFGISEDTLNQWISAYPDFRKALHAGRDGADETVVRALLARAVGYEHPEDDIRTVSLGDNQGSEIVITPTTKRYPPDVGAITMWLTNRRRGQWRSPNSTAEGDGGLSPQDRAAAVKAAVQAALAEAPLPQPASDDAPPQEP